jgi:hypothetical protein
MTRVQRRALLKDYNERIVCRRRASKLRKLGESVRWAGWSPAGQSLYAWMPRLINLPFDIR